MLHTILISAIGALLLIMWQSVESRFADRIVRLDALTARTTALEVWRGGAGESLEAIRVGISEMKRDQREMDRKINDLSDLIRSKGVRR